MLAAAAGRVCKKTLKACSMSGKKHWVKSPLLFEELGGSLACLWLA